MMICWMWMYIFGFSCVWNSLWFPVWIHIILQLCLDCFWFSGIWNMVLNFKMQEQKELVCLLPMLWFSLSCPIVFWSWHQSTDIHVRTHSRTWLNLFSRLSWSRDDPILNGKGLDSGDVRDECFINKSLPVSSL